MRQHHVQLAAYIWDLRFRIDTDLNDQTDCARRRPAANAPDAPNLDHSTRTCVTTAGRRQPTQPYPPRLPAYVEIRFKALSDLAGRGWQAANTGVTKATWNDTDFTDFTSQARLTARSSSPTPSSSFCGCRSSTPLPLPTPTP